MSGSDEQSTAMTELTVDQAITLGMQLLAPASQAMPKISTVRFCKRFPIRRTRSIYSEQCCTNKAASMMPSDTFDKPSPSRRMNPHSHGPLD